MKPELLLEKEPKRALTIRISESVLERSKHVAQLRKITHRAFVEYALERLVEQFELSQAIESKRT